MHVRSSLSCTYILKLQIHACIVLSGGLLSFALPRFADMAAGRSVQITAHNPSVSLRFVCWLRNIKTRRSYKARRDLSTLHETPHDPDGRPAHDSQPYLSFNSVTTTDCAVTAAEATLCAKP